MDFLVAKNLENTGKVKTIFTKKDAGDFYYNEESSYKDFINLGNQFNVNPDNIVRIFQCHDNKVMIVHKEDGGIGINRPEKEKKYDALITNEKNILITTIEADCVPILMLDIKNDVIANVHSGWRGTSKLIVKETIKEMIKHYNTDPKDLLIHMGPSICEKCYEVSSDLIDEFLKTYKDNDIDKIFIKKDNGKYLLNLKLAIKIKLLEAGVKEDNIEVSDICTFENKDFDSKRRDDKEKKGANGRMLSGIMLI